MDAMTQQYIHSCFPSSLSRAPCYVLILRIQFQSKVCKEFKNFFDRFITATISGYFCLWYGLYSYHSYTSHVLCSVFTLGCVIYFTGVFDSPLFFKDFGLFTHVRLILYLCSKDSMLFDFPQLISVGIVNVSRETASMALYYIFHESMSS